MTIDWERESIPVQKNEGSCSKGLRIGVKKQHPVPVTVYRSRIDKELVSEYNCIIKSSPILDYGSWFLGSQPAGDSL